MSRKVTVNITMPNTDDGEMSYIAAAPADHRHSYAGSGLPFQSETHAMDRTPNVGVVRGSAGKVVPVELYWPNSFRDSSTGVIVPPAIHLSWRFGGQELAQVKHLGPGIHSRALSYHPSRCALKADFYAGTHELEVRSQEEVLRAGGYDGGPKYTALDAPSEFWGDRPRL
jgi:hypothetical protein